MEEVAIYGVFDPRDGIIRYVGQTKRFPLTRRLGAHCSVAKSMRGNQFASHLARWLVSLVDDGVRPEITILEMTTGDQALYRERFWVEHFMIEGADMVNSTFCQESVSNAYWKKRSEERSEELRRTNPPPPPRYTPVPITPERAQMIRSFREEFGLSQTALARRLGYTNGTISLWESCKRSPPPGLEILLDKVRADLQAERGD
jgi:DNA-binding transcriptional regulator YiaG